MVNCVKFKEKTFIDGITSVITVVRAIIIIVLTFELECIDYTDIIIVVGSKSYFTTTTSTNMIPTKASSSSFDSFSHHLIPSIPTTMFIQHLKTLSIYSI